MRLGTSLFVIQWLIIDPLYSFLRKNELHQMAQQASNVERLLEVVRRSLGVMCKQWSDAMRVYHDKFNALSTLIVDHGTVRKIKANQL